MFLGDSFLFFLHHFSDFRLDSTLIQMGQQATGSWSSPIVSVPLCIYGLVDDKEGVHVNDKCRREFYEGRITEEGNLN